MGGAYTASEGASFPWLPGVGLSQDDARDIYGNNSAPPNFVMLTLAMLEQSCAPKGKAPAEWLAAIDADAMNASIRDFARRKLDLTANVFDEASQTYNWYGIDNKNPDGTPVAIPRDVALQRCWTGHAQSVLKDLSKRRETAAGALERISREWRQWVVAETAKFAEQWQDAAAWPPALALTWIMYAGDWGRMAEWHEYGSNMPSDMRLSSIGSFLEEGDIVANTDASKVLIRAMRLRPDNARRIIMFGRLNGQGTTIEVSPTDLVSLEWAINPSPTQGAVLEPSQGPYRSNLPSYTHVLVDATSLLRVFPPAEPRPTVAGERAAVKDLTAAVELHRAGRGPLPVFAHWRETAEATFSISGRGARRSWDEAAAKYSELSSPKNKSKRRRADTARS